uniref:Cyclin N-terminal domain-containing protein n=1 Tax=Sus scrofa TaxID=9823 RepID=A0A8D0PKP3_PIG
MEGERKNNNKRWYFTREQLENSPSRRFGLDPDEELSCRQQAANLLQDMGQRLNVSQLTINTAIVYMHRFYMIQSFTQFHQNLTCSIWKFPGQGLNPCQAAAGAMLDPSLLFFFFFKKKLCFEERCFRLILRMIGFAVLFFFLCHRNKNCKARYCSCKILIDSVWRVNGQETL